MTVTGPDLGHSLRYRAASKERTQHKDQSDEGGGDDGWILP
jgi:hypothetical protein